MSQQGVEFGKTVTAGLPLVVPGVTKPKRKRRKIIESPKSGSEDSF